MPRININILAIRKFYSLVWHHYCICYHMYHMYSMII